MKEYAKEYAKRGFYVLPVNNKKIPVTSNGFYDATKDLEKIEEYWTKWPDANIAIATGASKLTIIDIDTKNGVDVEIFLDSFGDLPDTLQSITPSGGRHVWFKNNKNSEIISKANKITKGVDVLSRTGYIVVPPSVTDQGDYSFLDESCSIEDIPEWLHSDLSKEKEEQNKEVEIRSDINIPLTEYELKRIRSALFFIDDVDDYDTWLKMGMALKTTRSPQGYGLWCEWSSQSDKFNPKKQKYTWDKINDFGDCTLGTLFFKARENGWHDLEFENSDVGENSTNDVEGSFEKDKFPTGLFNCPGLVGEVFDFINEQSIKQQPVLALAAALSACGTVMGRKIQTETGLRTNVYTLAVGESGCGKEAPRQIIRRIFAEAGIFPKVGVEDIASDSSIITALQSEPSSLFLLDEIGRFFKTTQGAHKSPHLYAISGLLMRLYGAANGPFAGKVYADKNKNVTIQQPNVSIFGTTVPKTLYESMTMEQATDGFLSRMMIFESEDPDPDKQKIQIRDIPDKIIEQIQAWEDKKTNCAPRGNIDGIQIPRPLIVYKTPEADRIFQEFEQDLKRIRKKLRKQGKPAAVYVRTSAQAEQLALIRAAGINSNNPEIDIDDAQWACRLSKFLSDNMLYLIEHYIADNQTESNTKRILRQIKEKGQEGLTKSALTRKNQRIKKYDREDIINTLLESEQIVHIKVANEKTKRTHLVYKFNPEREDL